MDACGAMLHGRADGAAACHRDWRTLRRWRPHGIRRPTRTTHRPGDHLDDKSDRSEVTSPAGYVGRPRPFALLADACRHPLVSVTAPAGYGKTSLVRDHLGSTARPSVWLGLSAARTEAAAVMADLL